MPRTAPADQRVVIRPELLSLNFDAYERLSAIGDALDAAGVGAHDLVLDVGGHPGLLASALAGRCRIMTADFPPTGRAPYVRGSGEALPFAEGAFTAVVASDTLEHVPPAGRERFLAEMWRVARRLVLVGGPYATAGVARAEARLLELEGVIRAAPDRWLAEHAEHGLPSLLETWNAFATRGGKVAALPNGDLLRWFILFAGRVVLEELPEGTAALDAFLPDYNCLFGPLPGGPSAPTYRHLVIAVKDATLFRMTEEATGPTITRPDQIQMQGTPEDSAAAQRIDALALLFQSVAAALQAQARRSQQGGSLEAAYLEQAERALVQQNERLEQLQQQLEAASSAGGQSRLGRILRRMRSGAGPR